LKTRRTDTPAPEPEFDKLLRWLLLHRGTALYLEPGQAPRFRLGGVLHAMELAPLSQEELRALLSPVLNSQQRRALRDACAVEFDYVLNGPPCTFRVGVIDQGGRFRVSVYRNRSRPGVAEWRTVA
jgi:Tfp pilus assembly pilus retraction ATPase PilT